VLVVAAWHEGEPPVVVARITYTLDVTTADRLTVAAAGLDEIGAFIEGWLQDVETSGKSR
jgi:hypothetical protein